MPDSHHPGVVNAASWHGPLWWETELVAAGLDDLPFFCPVRPMMCLQRGSTLPGGVYADGIAIAAADLRRFPRSVSRFSIRVRPPPGYAPTFPPRPDPARRSAIGFVSGANLKEIASFRFCLWVL